MYPLACEMPAPAKKSKKNIKRLNMFLKLIIQFYAKCDLGLKREVQVSLIYYQARHFKNSMILMHTLDQLYC